MKERKVAKAHNWVDQMESMSLVLTIMEWKAPNFKMSQIEVWPFLLIVELSPLPLIAALWQLEFQLNPVEDFKF